MSTLNTAKRELESDVGSRLLKGSIRGAQPSNFKKSPSPLGKGIQACPPHKALAGGGCGHHCQTGALSETKKHGRLTSLARFC